MISGLSKNNLIKEKIKNILIEIYLVIWWMLTFSYLPLSGFEIMVSWDKPTEYTLG